MMRQKAVRVYLVRKVTRPHDGAFCRRLDEDREGGDLGGPGR